MRELQEGLQELELLLTVGFDLFPALGISDHGANRQREDVHQAMLLGAFNAWIPQATKVSEDRQLGDCC
jgi:hypothetical protein